MRLAYNVANGSSAEIRELLGSGAAVLSSDGAFVLLVSSMPATYSWNADGTLNWEQVTDGTDTWRRTYTYTSGRMTAASAWVRQ